MRSKIALKNALATALSQIVVLICGIIVPKLTIEYYGSTIYGLISSMASLMSIIALGEAGVGGVVRAAYYKPLAYNDIENVNGIWNSSRKYFTILGIVFIPYVIVVSAYFCFINNSGVALQIILPLCLIVSAQYFLQYFYALPNRLLLYADNKAAKLKVWETITTILHLVVVFLLIKINAGVIVVKAGSTLAYMLTPVLIGIYVSRHYMLKRSTNYNKELLKQKWDGLGHHIAYYINNNIDIIVLTFLANSISVSVYSVYYFVVTSLNKIISVVSEGTDAIFGNLLAKNEIEALLRNVSLYETLIFFVSSVLFSTAFIMLMPFINIYTAKFDNVSLYYNPIFGYVLLAATIATTIRIPYNHIITSAGHYRQTKKYAYTEACINVVLSAILVWKFGIVGVAIGTFVAAIYRTIVYVMYLKNNILERSPKIVINKVITMCINILIVISVAIYVPLFEANTIMSWFIRAILFALISIAVSMITTSLFYKKDVKNMIALIKGLIKR